MNSLNNNELVLQADAIIAELAASRSIIEELRIEMGALQQDRSALIELSEDHARMLQAMQIAQEELDAHNDELIASRDSLRELQSRYQKLFKQAPFAYLIVNVEGNITDCNQLAAQFFEHEPAYLLHKPLSRFILKTQYEKLRAFFRSTEDMAQDDDPCTVEVTLRHANDKPHKHVLLQALVEHQAGNKLIYRVALIDLSGLDAVRADLLRSHRVLDQMREGVVITNPEGLIQRVNQSFCEISGYIKEEVLGKSPNLLSSGKHDNKFYEVMWKSITEKGWWHGEIWNRRKSGELYLEWLLISTIYDELGHVENFVAVFSDVTTKKRTEIELARMAHYDELTGLPNRVLGFDRLEQMVQFAHRDNGRFAVLFMDLDRFKAVNDSYGHRAGDMVLKEAAQRFSRCLRTSDSVVRLGGDEFLVLLGHIENANDIIHVSDKIIAAISEPFKMAEGILHQIGTSIGAAIYPNDAVDAETLVRHADIAMYRAKKAGKNQLILFDTPLQNESLNKSSLEQALRRAIEKREFFMVYQPKLELQEKRLVGLEALVRWRTEDGEVMSPDAFIPAAEEFDLMHRLGKLILEMVCRDYRVLSKQNFILPRVAFNLSVMQFQSAQLENEILSTMRQFGCDPANFAVEITESVAMLDLKDVVSKLEKLRSIGLHIHIDDFGTGYSSLAYLKHLPADLVKIDQAFISELISDPRNRVLVDAAIVIGHSLNMDVIAEGIETEEEYRMLAQMGCDQGQGYLFARPLSLPDLIVYLQMHQHDQIAA
jgi:diguanylate cyclase (GGDEF)-like protein/PAS domain S-box-containing protein